MPAVKYSKYDLLNKEYDLPEKRSVLLKIFNFLSGERYRFDIPVPNDMYVRADVLCDDIVHLSDHDIQFKQSDLIEHIYFDFLDEVRRNDSNVGSIYNRITVRKQELPFINNHPIVPVRSTTVVTVELDKEEALRAEVLLEDLSYFFPKHEWNVEKLIQVVYLDFLLEYVRGRRKNVLKEIVQYLN
ncbi:hypothetical protein [Sutcliffiella halmapala]|uniref:hypothetical protein n=1 Tax=Sutcliffiella halmapala TaxID=79882 RepID=UPI0009958FC7|nr:hypothetical protein [Sutcliffiella halmapala]